MEGRDAMVVYSMLMVGAMSEVRRPVANSAGERTSTRCDCRVVGGGANVLGGLETRCRDMVGLRGARGSLVGDAK
jgi:hypothetical protein